MKEEPSKKDHIGERVAGAVKAFAGRELEADERWTQDLETVGESEVNRLIDELQEAFLEEIIADMTLQELAEFFSDGPEGVYASAMQEKSEDECAAELVKSTVADIERYIRWKIQSDRVLGCVDSVAGEFTMITDPLSKWGFCDEENGEAMVKELVESLTELFKELYSFTVNAHELAQFLEQGSEAIEQEGLEAQDATSVDLRTITQYRVADLDRFLRWKLGQLEEGDLA